MAAGGDVVVVMARYPTPGAVKTRLARAIGASHACDLYAAFLRDLALRLRSDAWSLVWAVDPPRADLTEVVGAGSRQIAQRGRDLAARMRHCFDDLFAGGARRVVMLGADAPHVGPDVVGTAFAALSLDDAVFVPTRDGGYCLIGLCAAHDLFSGVSMGGAEVFAQTEGLLGALGLRWSALASTFDIDELDDLHRLDALVGSGAVDLPHTAAALRAWQRSAGR
ncbi:MAG: TIGR04282 family arsenosugar biosynthesis glycosyltransferase [Candidatus Binatia bacterium]